MSNESRSQRIQRFEPLEVLVEHGEAEQMQRHPHREEQLCRLRVQWRGGYFMAEGA